MGPIGMSRWGRAAAGAALFAAAAAPAQNLFANPELTESQLVSGWTKIFGGFLDWTGVDADGCTAGGSAQLPSAETDVGSQYAHAGQCLPISAATWPEGAHAAFAYSSPGAESVYIALLYNQLADCTGPGAGSHFEFGLTGPGWHRVAMDDLAIPANALGVFAGIGAEAGGLVPIELLFDRAWFGRASPIFTDDFEEGFCRWDVEPPF